MLPLAVSGLGIGSQMGVKGPLVGDALFARGETGDGFRSLGHGVLCKLTGERQADGSLDVDRRHRLGLVVARQGGGLNGESLEDVVDEG